MAITWTPRNAGSAAPAPTAEDPDLYQLRAPQDAFYQFNGSGVSGLVSSLTLATSNYYGYYIETDTNRGRRQFKFIPRNTAPVFELGYRYVINLGHFSRNGTRQTFALDLSALAEALEPGVTINRIKRVFVRTIGDMAIQVVGDTAPPPPPPPPPPTGELTPEEIVRFLNQTSFGATDATVAQLAALGSYEAWIDQQFDLPPSLTEPYVVALGSSSSPEPRHQIWWKNVMEQPDQLRQRLAFALSQIFVVSDRDYVLSNSQYGMTNYYDMLATAGDGNFRDLLERVTLHPVMGIFVSMLRNEKADPARNVRPDENFAREVLQLFTIGLYELTPDGQPLPQPTFDQAKIEEFAKVFTGWYHDGLRYWTDNNIPASSFQVPMVADESFHDTSEKRLFNGVTLPANQSAYADLTAALDNIFNHPNVGPFIARLLIQRLVTSNPTPLYVGRVAAVFNNNGSGVRGDMRAVVKALLLDDEARNGPTTLPATFGKIKEPLMRITNLWRGLNARPGPEANGRWNTYARPDYRVDEFLGQGVMRASTVFNFYQFDNPLEPGSELDAPEMQILSEINVAVVNNVLLQAIYGDNNRSQEYRQHVAQIQIEPEIELAADVEALLDRLQLILTAGQLPPAVRAAITEVIAAHPSDDAGRYNRVLDAAYCIVGSPFHLVQK